MRRLVGILLLLVSCARPFDRPTQSAVTLHAADLVLTSGDIWTNVQDAPRASALAIADGRIVAVGVDAKIRSWIGPRTKVVELSGHTVFPGLVDGHIHLFRLGQTFSSVDLHGARSPETVRDLIKARLERDSSPWLRGDGWNHELWSPPAFPTHTILDQVAPDRPVWLRRVDGHAAWALRGTRPDRGSRHGNDRASSGGAEAARAD